jgi:hypothetical protein
MAKVNQACSDASFLKTAGGAILVAFAFRFVPFVSGLGAVAFLCLLFAVPAMAIRWWVKFSRIVSSESDFRRAKKVVAVVGIAASLALILDLLVIVATLAPAFRSR